MKINKSFLIAVAPLLFLLMWSSGAVFAKVGLQYTDSWSFLLIRSTIAVFLLSILLSIQVRNVNAKSKIFKKPNRNELILIISSGVLLQIFYLVFYFLAIESQMSIGLIILILGTQPLLTMIFFLKQATIRQFLLLTTCFIGLCVSMLGYYTLNEINMFGIIFSVLSLLCITFGTIIQSKTSSHPLLMLWVQTMVAWVVFLLLACFKGITFQYHWKLVVASLWMGGVVSVGALLLLIAMLNYNSVNKVSSLFFMLPILTIFLDSLIFKTDLSALSIIGAVVVCGSLFVYQHYEK